ncbi:MAG: MBOAT family protein [Bacteroidia bacterium]|nr:MBOAT family protein [Bacteroidia bacterium]
MYFIPKYILCLFFLIIVDYVLALKIDAAEEQRRKKLFLALSIVSNFGLLFYFKYLGFFTETLNAVLLDFFGKHIKVSNEILPIGLSFHTFQSVSYVVDVYRGKQKPEKHLGIYSTYVLFFPQMVAGPIERFSTLGNELKKTVSFSFEFVKKALPLFLIGLFYKAVIADNCGDYVNQTYATLASQNNWNVLIAVFLFSIQIYADFFGYSLMAQASAHLFGIRLIDNFSFPFFSRNIIEFWKKWHISLTGWFRDYVYIPLGGNRGSLQKYAFNIALIFTLSGLWHGAGINFILWGFLHALCYIFTVLLIKQFNIRLPAILGYVTTFIVVAFIFVFFRIGSINESMAIFRQIFQQANSSPFLPVSIMLGFNLFIVFFIELLAHKHLNYSAFISRNSKPMNAVLFLYLLFAVLVFSGVDNLPFIYFQF